MLRFRASTDAKAGYHYFSKSDSGLDPDELRKEVGGKGAELLGLSPEPDFDQFKNLLHGLDPHTGEQLTAKLVDHRISYWDVTASVPKGVTIAIEHGDSRVHDALWEAGREAMLDLEEYVITRMRKGGEHADRLTGNMIWYGFEHPETRPNREDGMPDPDRHIHFVVPNVTYDPVEKEWKAIKFRPIMDLRKWFDRRFDARLASKLTDLGYSIETKYKDGKYFSWDIKDVPQSVVKKYSRRGAEVDALAEKLGIQSATSKDKLGATSRLHKRDDMTLEDYRKYWLSRLTPREHQLVAEVIRTANLGENPEPANTADKGVAWAIRHHFERRSVVPGKELEVAAMERCMGGAKPEEIEPEMLKQGVLFKDGQATTREVLAEEGRIIDFARVGKGTCRPMGRPGTMDAPGTVERDSATLPGSGQQKGRPDESKRPSVGRGDAPDDTATLSPEQQALVAHVLTSPDRLVLVIGDAGTGKTHAIKAAFRQIDRPVEMLAPSADASRGVLRSEGFRNADTVASFLVDEKRQSAIKNGVIWVDEVGLLPIRDLSKLVDIAKQQNARLVLQGDPKQHRSPARHGDMMNVLQEYAGLPVGRLTEIWRQVHKGYKQVVADIAAKKGAQAFDKLADMGWVQQVESNTPLVDDYLAGMDAGKTQLVVAPTHKEGEEITAEIRQRLRLEKKLGEDKQFDRLVPLNWTEAEKGDLERYDGTEVMVFHRNSGTFKAGDKVAVKDWKKGMRYKSPEHFSVYRPAKLALAAGDVVRFTRNGESKDGHKVNNGSVYRVKGFDRDGDIMLDNGWTVDKAYEHLSHGYVSTSHASQGKTVDRVLIAMGSESQGAINAEQFYVSVSRGRQSAKVYSDLAAEELKQAILKTDQRKSATELMKPKRKPGKLRDMMKQAKEKFRRLRETVVGVTREKPREQERYYGPER